MNLFPRQDIRFLNHAEMQLLYAITKKIKVALVKEIFKHWLDLFKASTNILCTSLVTSIATSIEVLE